MNTNKGETIPPEMERASLLKNLSFIAKWGGTGAVLSAGAVGGNLAVELLTSKGKGADLLRLIQDNPTERLFPIFFTTILITACAGIVANLRMIGDDYREAVREHQASYPKSEVFASKISIPALGVIPLPTGLFRRSRPTPDSTSEPTHLPDKNSPTL